MKRLISIVVIISCLITHVYPQTMCLSYKSLPSCKHTVLLYSCVDEEDSLVFTSQRKMLVSKKSPWVALGLALIPGFIIHGIGHFYAGKPLVGSVLLICGIIGTGLIIVGFIIIAVSGGILTPSIILTVFTGTPIGISESVAGIRTAIGLLQIGGILFFGSWAVDIVGAPISCILRNRKIEHEISSTTTIPFFILRF